MHVSKQLNAPTAFVDLLESMIKLEEWQVASGSNAAKIGYMQSKPSCRDMIPYKICRLYNVDKIVWDKISQTYVPTLTVHGLTDR